MAKHIPAKEYFDQHYSADYEVFGSTAMCGFSLADSMNNPKRARLKSLAEFVVCEFELNLLHQAFYTHASSACYKWREFSAPFADTHGCSMGHGMANQFPYSILRFAQQPFADPHIAPISIGWEILSGYTKYFLDDYLLRFAQITNAAEFSCERFLSLIARDPDCVACVLSPSGWETKQVMEILKM